MRDFIETAEIELTCLTPVHVGNGRTLNKAEYVFDYKKGTIYFLDERKWLSFLRKCKADVIPGNERMSGNGFDVLRNLYQVGTPGKVDEYKKYVKFNFGRKLPEPLYDWCGKNGISMNDVATCSLAKTNIGSEKKDLNDLHPFMRHPDGTIYIPGSSIKGAMRTALLFSEVKNSSQRQMWWNSFKNIPPHKKNEFSKLAKQIEQDCFHTYNGYEDRGRKIIDARASVLRGIRISDARLVGKMNMTEVYRKCDVSLHKNKHGETMKLLPLYRECAAVEMRFRCTITLEKEYLKPLGIDSVDGLLENMKTFVQQIIGMEKSVFAKNEDYWSGMEDLANLFLGGGTGLLTKTVAYALAPQQEVLRVVREYLDSFFATYDRRTKSKKGAHDHCILDNQLSPRTLKVAGNLHHQYHMGLCKLEVVPKR